MIGASTGRLGTMQNSGGIFLGLAVVSLVIGLAGQTNAVVDGMGKAFFGVFMILFLILRLFGEKNA